MMDYTAGPGRHSASEASPAANQVSTAQANSIRARAYAATGGSASMNITTGGPHVLLFERDQQLVVLLTSELQLAGYECHAARTAVEVFDAIARYPVRLVLVNLAQAAAARREFWVALDTQRRGRGVQVFTFHCTNIAGYGPRTEDPDDRSQNMLADIEVDGMLGIMNMVNAIRSRIAISNTGTMSRPASSTYAAPQQGVQATAPVPAVPARTGSSTPQAEVPPIPATPAPGYTDKIRAVIYPNQRSASPMRDGNTAGESQIGPVREQKEQQSTRNTQERSWSPRSPQNASIAAAPSTPPNSSLPADTFIDEQEQGGRSMSETSLPKESGLAQLSRMLQENRMPILEEMAREHSLEQESRFQEEMTLQQRSVRSGNVPSLAPLQAPPDTPPLHVPPISTMSLRASPIQDMPTDRGSAGQGDMSSQTSARYPDESSHLNYSQPPVSPTLISISTPAPTLAPAAMAQAAQSNLASPSPPGPVPPPVPIAPTVQQDSWNVIEETYNTARFTVDEVPAVEEKNTRDDRSTREERDYDDDDTRGVRQSQTTVSEQETTIQKVPDNALLIDIVQSLPPMTSPPAPQVHNGRATRSLGRVLLEGHLVPQNRLEVAQGIQRMLRGVDMNYQLGEILLMFKLLTPDQLLAASLVSYGLITTAQISALGRIRQELHSIGLEYDLENLLILFRILTSEQLREVRTGWSG